jgi:hypothetical protein
MRRAPVGFLLVVALFTTACGAGANGVTGTSGSPSAAAVEPTPSTAALPTQAATASAAPTAKHPTPTASPAPKPTPTPAPSAEAPSPSAVPSDSPVASEGASPPASASTLPSPTDAADLPCQPEGSNPNFWPGIARSVGWDVYCAVLPKGWSVASGSYRLADGGKLVISYKGPNGATLTLSEGSFCADDSGCVPSGSEVGSASFGSLDGTLVASDGGGYSIVADRGQTPSWLMTTTGLDQATSTALGASLAHVGG